MTEHTHDKCNKKIHPKSREWLTLSGEGREDSIEDNTGISICFMEKKKKKSKVMKGMTRSK